MNSSNAESQLQRLLSNFLRTSGLDKLTAITVHASESGKSSITRYRICVFPTKQAVFAQNTHALKSLRFKQRI